MGLEDFYDDELESAPVVANTNQEISTEDLQALRVCGIALTSLNEQDLANAVIAVKGYLQSQSGLYAKMQDLWETQISEEDKLRIYNNGTISAIFINRFMSVFGGSYDSRILNFGGFGNNIAPTLRSMMMIGMLKPPESIVASQLQADAVKDQSDSELAMKVINFVPQLRAFKPQMQVLAKLNTKLHNVRQRVVSDNVANGGYQNNLAA